MTAIILAALALVVAVVALIISLKRQKVVKETTKVVEQAPVDNPFHYDVQAGTYTLDGNLYVKGSISCLINKSE